MLACYYRKSGKWFGGLPTCLLGQMATLSSRFTVFVQAIDMFAMSDRNVLVARQVVLNRE